MRLRYFIILCGLVIAIAVLLPYSTPSSQEFDFNISTSLSELSLSVHARVSANTTVQCMVNVTLTRGSPQPVNLTLSGLPSSFPKYSFNPNIGLPPFTSTLVISTDVSPPPGIYELTITGTGGGKSHSIQVTLDIEF